MLRRFTNHFILLALSLCLLGISAHAKSNKADSLYAIIQSTTNDSLRISLMLELAVVLEPRNIDSGLVWSDIARKEAKKHEDEGKVFLTLKGRAMMRKGITLVRYKHEYDNGVSLLKEAFKVFEASDYSVGKAGCLTTMGIVANVQSDYQKSLDLHTQALDISKASGDSLHMAFSYNNIGLVHLNQGRYTDGLESMQQALLINESLQNEEQMARLYNNIGGIHAKLGNYEQAIYYHTKTLEIYKAREDEISVGLTYNNIGVAHRQIDDLDSALYYFRKSAEIHDRHQQKGHLISPLNNIGLTLFDLGHYDEAQPYYNRALEIARELGHRSEIVMVSGNSAMLKQMSGQHEEAIEQAKEALALCLEIGTTVQQCNMFQILYQSYEGVNNLDSAFRYHKLYATLHDSILLEENKQAVANLELDYKSRQQERELEKQEVLLAKQEIEAKAKNQERWMLTGGVLVLIVLILLIYRSYRIKTNANQQLRSTNKMILEQKQQIESQASELREINHGKDKLFSIISHDLRGPFSSLQSIIELSESGDLSQEEVDQLLKKVSKSMNYTSDFLENLLHWAKSQQEGFVLHPSSFSLAPMVDEITGLLEKQIQQKGIVTNNQVDPSLQLHADPDILKLVLRNLIANAVKYSHEGGKIYIETVERDGDITIQVRDEGVGMDESKLKSLFSNGISSVKGTGNEQGTGLGLLLCKDFVKLHGGQISAESEPGKGSTLSFSIPKA